jgi:uroporphyrinogen-III synthase
MGLEVHGAPLFAIQPVTWDAPDPTDYDGLLVGSANVFRHGGKALANYRDLPVHVVGETTADAARAAGFAVSEVGHGGLQLLLDELAERDLDLLRLAGEERVALSVPQGTRVDTRVVYRAVPQELARDAAQMLRSGAIVALHSGAAARHFAAECDRLDVERSAVALAVIGTRVAEAAGIGWQSIHIAGAPKDAEVLALANALCQTPLKG